MGIGGFRLSDKTSTQTDNTTGGQTEVLGNTEGPWGRQGPDMVFVTSSTEGAF